MRYELIYMLLPYLLVFYCVLFVMVFLRRYIREYTYNKRLIFTRDSIKEIRQEINDIISKGEYGFSNKNNKKEYFITERGIIILIMSIYNELAVGINEGLYDELYVKTIMGKQIFEFYKKHYNQVIESSTDWEESQYIPLELLLKKWTEKNAPTYTVKNGRSF